MASKLAVNSAVAKIVPIVVILAAFIIAIAGNSTYTIKYGSVGVVTRFGKIVGDPVKPGLHFKIPFADNVLVYRTQKVIYETLDKSVQPYSNASNADYQDYAVDTTTKDGQQISVRYTVRFSINPDKVEEVANKLGTEQEVVEKIVKTDSRIWARNVPRNFEAIDLYTGNIDMVSNQIHDQLKPLFEANGLILDEFGIRSINFQTDYVDTIEKKQIEKEKIVTEEYKAKQEEFKKQAQITKAQGEAEAQRLQQLTLTKELIQKLYIEKWDGKLPTTMTGDNGSLLLNLNK